jgi:hypothetical protein
MAEASEPRSLGASELWPSVNKPRSLGAAEPRSLGASEPSEPAWLYSQSGVD